MQIFVAAKIQYIRKLSTKNKCTILFSNFSARASRDRSRGYELFMLISLPVYIVLSKKRIYVCLSAQNLVDRFTVGGILIVIWFLRVLCKILRFIYHFCFLPYVLDMVSLFFMPFHQVLASGFCQFE